MLTREFEVIPAIDVLEGRAVRLREGCREQVTLEAGDPVALAERFAADGARRLHLVDLDGAFTGVPATGLLERVVAVGLPVQVGGGYRTPAAIAAALAAGADRVMIGTAATDEHGLADALAVAGDRLVVAVDVRDGRIAVEGWTAAADITPATLVRRCADNGVARLLVTATRRDGSLDGPDIDLLRPLCRLGPAVIAAGGIAGLADLVALRSLGCEAAVAGSALLAGRFTLAEAQAALTAAAAD